MGKLKILVTGKDGQLGYALQELSENQFEFTWKFTDRSELDITDLIKTQSVLKHFQPDWIINTAAYTDVDGAESNEEIAYKVNADGPYILAKSAKEIGAKLVHISTDYVFDGTKKEPFSENDKPNPLQVYGKSKLKGELLIQDTNISGFIIRTSWVYGNHGKNFVNTILKLAKTKNEIEVVDDQFGSPTYVKDLANVVIDLVSKRQFNDLMAVSEKPVSLNLSNNLFDTNEELIDTISDQTNSSLNTTTIAENNVSKVHLSHLLSRLGTREQYVLTLRYGLEDGRERTQKDIAKFLSVSAERVRQIELSALAKLRLLVNNSTFL